MVLRRSSAALGGGSSDVSALVHSLMSLSGVTKNSCHPGDVTTRQRACLPLIDRSVPDTFVLPCVMGTAPFSFELNGNGGGWMEVYAVGIVAGKKT